VQIHLGLNMNRQFSKISRGKEKPKTDTVFIQCMWAWWFLPRKRREKKR